MERVRAVRVAVFALLVSFLIATPLPSNASSGSPNGSGAKTAHQSTPSGRCPPAWSFVPFVAGSGVPASPALFAVSGTGPGDVWGVGQASAAALVLHFDGSSWTAPPQPDVPGSLDAVVAISATDAWAVGFRSKTRGSRTLVEHWDGSRWKAVTDPGTAFAHGELHRVVADGPDDVWAVGTVADRHGLSRAFVERWDGSGWSETPQIASAGLIDPKDLAVVSSNDAWMVGTIQGGGTLAEHWDGSAWTIVPTPNVGVFTSQNRLISIAAGGPDDVWAAGGSGRYHTPPLIEHWNGLRWSIVQSTGPQHTALSSMLAESPDDVWVLGPHQGTYIEHWDGRAWAQVSPIFTRGRPLFLGPFGSAGPGEIWAGAGARICPVVLSDTGMSPRYADTTSPIPLRAVRVPRVVPRTVAWRVDPLAGEPSRIREMSLGLFDSGPILPGGSFTYTFWAAGTYSILHEPSEKTGTVGIPIRVRPPHGSLTQVFHVFWGFGVSDVQVKPPGSTRFVMWQSGTSDSDADFGPSDPLWAGPGVYVFRARLHSSDTGAVTDWSPQSSVTVRPGP